MNLFILRHASAGTSRPNPLVDRKRPLDKEGKKHCLQLAAILNSQKTQFDLIISSPLKRSLQTAQLLATETGYEAQIVHSEALAPIATFKDFQKLLQTVSVDFPEKENVLVVGHNPNLAIFLATLILPVPVAVVPKIRLRKGSLAHVSYGRGPAILQNLIDPRVVRASFAAGTKRPRGKAASRKPATRKKITKK
jgi:phosphohistidine phosphatase